MSWVQVLCAVLAFLLLLYLGTRWLRGRHPYAIERAAPLAGAPPPLASYRVHHGHARPREAAARLGRLNSQATELLRHLRKRYVREGGGSSTQRALARRLLRRYDPDAYAESSPLNPEGDTAFTVKKGKMVALCLREKDPARTGDDDVHDFIPDDLLRFVLFHELTHVAMEKRNHPPEFWAAFKWLLLESEEAGFPPSEDYRLHPARYCGLEVDYNPRYDPAIPLP
jgi:hypothetical protein